MLRICVLDLDRIVDGLAEQREAIAKLESSIAQGHFAILKELRRLCAWLFWSLSVGLLAIAVGVWWR
jgi:hypothetical protein